MENKILFSFSIILFLFVLYIRPARAAESSISVKGGFIDLVLPQQQHVMGGLLEADYIHAFPVRSFFSIGVGGSFVGGFLSRPYLALNILLFNFEFTVPLIFHVSEKVDLYLRAGGGLAFHLLVQATSQFQSNTLLTVGTLWRSFFGISIKINETMGLMGESGYVGTYNSFCSDTPTLKESYLLVHGFQINAGIKFYVSP